jgi:hypothetical protein
MFFTSWGSSVSIVKAVGWTAGVRFPTGTRDFSRLHRVQTGYSFNQASYPMAIGGSFPGVKTAGSWSWPMSSAEINKDRAASPLPHTSSCLCLINSAQEQFHLYFLSLFPLVRHFYLSSYFLLLLLLFCTDCSGWQFSNVCLESNQ